MRLSRLHSVYFSPLHRGHVAVRGRPVSSAEPGAGCCPLCISYQTLLGLVLEEQHYATETYGLQRKADRDRDELSDAKSAARQDEVLAVCKLHGFPHTPTLENQLRALDKEYPLLREQGQSSRADYVQALYMWLSKKTGKESGSALRNEENQSSVHRALMKYLDTWSLSPDSWEYNLHVGRLLLLLQGRSREALQHLQSGLALRPLHPALRSDHRVSHTYYVL
ncbi:uncharacterized protein [Paralichthys olivaceus]|uniref:uncharacterized protein n=1 Tax=Paralichthys olivaceus TaxID=8255 RepID=UPI0037513561